MLPAKWFVALAIAVAVLAFLVAAGAVRGPSFGRQSHGTYFVVASYFQVCLFGALLCGAFAIIYYLCARWILLPLNQTLGIVHFSLTTLTVVLFAAGSYASARAMHGGGLAEYAFRFFAGV